MFGLSFTPCWGLRSSELSQDEQTVFDFAHFQLINSGKGKLTWCDYWVIYLKLVPSDTLDGALFSSP